MDLFGILRYVQIYPLDRFFTPDKEKAARMEKKLQEAIHYLGPKWVGYRTGAKDANSSD